MAGARIARASAFLCLAFVHQASAAPQVTVAVRSVPSGVLYAYRVFNGDTRAITQLAIGDVPGHDSALTAAPAGVTAPDRWAILADRVEERSLWRVQWTNTRSPIVVGQTQCGFGILSTTSLATFATPPFTVGFGDGTEFSGNVVRDDSMPVCGTTALSLQYQKIAEPVKALVNLAVAALPPVVVKSLQLFVDGKAASAISPGSQRIFQWDTKGLSDQFEHVVRIQYVSTDGVVHDGPSMTIWVDNQQ